MRRFVLRAAAAVLASATFLAAAGAEDPGQRVETVLKDEKGAVLEYPSCFLTPADGHPVYPIRVEVNGRVIIRKDTSGLLRCRHHGENLEATLRRHQANQVTLHTLPPMANGGSNKAMNKCQVECFKLIDVPPDASRFPDRFYAEETPEFYQCMQTCPF